jgi:hypothetical protein
MWTRMGVRVRRFRSDRRLPEAATRGVGSGPTSQAVARLQR